MTAACESCKWWRGGDTADLRDPETDYRTDEQDLHEWGTCMAVAFAGPRQGNQDRFYVIDASTYSASLHTRADFGCNQHEPRGEPVLWITQHVTFTDGGIPSGQQTRLQTENYYCEPLPETWRTVHVQPRRYWPPRYVSVNQSEPDTPEARAWFDSTLADVAANFDTHAESAPSGPSEQP